MRGPRTFLVPLALTATVAVVAAGCSSGTSTSTPTPSASQSVSPTPSATPSATASPTASPTVSPSPTPTSTSAVSVYFLKGEKVQPVRRSITAGAIASQAVRWLLQGPTPGESGQGLSSTIPSGTTLRSLTVLQGLATVDLSGRYTSGGGTLSMQARVAEVVFTLTQFPTVDRVAFEVDGKPLRVLGGEGLVLSKPQTRADWEGLSPAVLVEHPRWGEPFHSRQRVTGTANTFEAVFFLELRDAQDKVLLRVRVKASSGTGTRGTFDVTLRPTITDPGPGTLRSFVYSPRDGSRQDITSIPVLLVP